LESLSSRGYPTNKKRSNLSLKKSLRVVEEEKRSRARKREGGGGRLVEGIEKTVKGHKTRLLGGNVLNLPEGKLKREGHIEKNQILEERVVWCSLIGRTNNCSRGKKA